MQVLGLQNGGAGCEHGGEVGDDMLMGFKGGGRTFSQVSDATCISWSELVVALYAIAGSNVN